MKKLLIALLTILTMSGCARQIQPNDVGYNIMVTKFDSSVTTNCERLGMVRANLEGSSAQYWNMNELNIQIETQVRELVALQYPDADTVAIMDKNTIASMDIDVQAIALKCFGSS